MRRVRRARREVGEERLVGHERLLLADPVDRAVGHVLGEVVALLRGAVRLDRDGAVVQRRRVLVGLPADEAVEMLEPAATAGPGVERPQRARLPDRYLVALAELRGRVAVELERLGERCRGVRADRVVAGRGRGDLGDPAHPDGVVVATGQQRLARRRAERRRVEAVVLQAVRGESLGGRRRARSAEGARGAEAGVVEQDDQHVRRTRRRPQRLDRREGRVGILRVVGDQALVRTVRDRQDIALHRHQSCSAAKYSSATRVLVACSPDRLTPSGLQVGRATASWSRTNRPARISWTAPRSASRRGRATARPPACGPGPAGRSLSLRAITGPSMERSSSSMPSGA